MTAFDDREKGFERKYAHDEEMAFKLKSRRNRLFGEWAATQLGKAGDEAYVKSVVLSDLEAPGDEDIVGKVTKDFAAAQVSISDKDIRRALENAMAEARKQLGVE